MLVVFVSTLGFMALSGSLRRHFGFPVPLVSAILAAVAAGAWLLSVRLHNVLLARRAAQEANPATPRTRITVTEAGLRWVTQLTNLALGIALAAAIPLVEAIAP
jgi:hypothetical protein